MFFIILLYIRIFCFFNIRMSLNQKTRKQKKQNRKTNRKRRTNRRRKMRGGECGCNTNMNAKLLGPTIGGSTGLGQLPIRYYYQMNPMNVDLLGAQRSERGLMGGKRNKRHSRSRKKQKQNQKGGTLNATEIMNKLGDVVETPFSTKVLLGTPYVHPSVTEQPINSKYGDNNPYLV